MKLGELKQDNVKITENFNEVRQELKQDILDSTMQLADKIIDTNKCINALENTVETTLYEQTIVIENKQKQTLIINSDDSKKIINTREVYKIQSQQSYLVSKNIQFDVYTHSIKTIK